MGGARAVRSQRCVWVLAAAALSAGAGAAPAPPVSFQPLGFLDGFPKTSVAWGISADGATIVGESISGVSQPDPEAWRWLGETGPMQPLGTLNPTFYSSTLFAVSDDGRYGAGQSYQVSGGINLFNVAVRCDMQATPNPQWRSLGALPGAQNINSTAFGINADGSVIVGVAKSMVSGEEVDQAFRYVVTSNSPFSGTMSGLGFLPGDNQSQASGVSADGTVVVGASLNPFTGNARGFRWQAPGPMTELECPPGMTGITLANAVSADGTVIVGAFADGGTGDQAALRWTPAHGTGLLPDLPGAPAPRAAAARALSADARVIVGYATGTAPGETEAVIWTYRGVDALETVLNSAGVDTTGWHLAELNAISADGRVVVGSGRDPLGRRQAFRAVLPLDIDFNFDGVVNPDDLGDYITCYFDAENGVQICLRAEYNQDGVLNPDDLGDYITGYFAD